LPQSLFAKLAAGPPGRPAKYKRNKEKTTTRNHSQRESEDRYIIVEYVSRHQSPPHPAGARTEKKHMYGTGKLEICATA